ncbi:MAG: DUF4432 family protein [Ignavibacteria bacterium]|nr:DUF4432 family protein [Ignavibacteria bacterium]
MAILFGRDHSREDLQKRVGHLLQVAGVRLMTLTEGSEAGVHIADVRSGSGLRFQVSLDRGMDISMADYKGIPLAWRSASGDVHPSYYDPRGLGWARSFPGGLLTGCGLTYLGAPCVDEGEELGLHGRLSNTPATDIKTGTQWVDDRCIFTIDGVIRESTPFGYDLVLRRTIEIELGESTITLRDVVSNEGYRRSPLMILYHINPGWPLVDEGAKLLLDAASTIPRDEEATKGFDRATTMSGPLPNFKEQVFFHDLKADGMAMATALLANTKLKLGLFVRYRQTELPRFIEWKMMGEGAYVLGLEPANCWVQGRARERERGTLQFLDPGERRTISLQIGILDGNEAIDNFAREYNLR